MSEESLRTNFDGLTRTLVEKHHGWSAVSNASSVAVDSVTEVIPAADSVVYGRLSLSSSSQQSLTSNSVSLVSSVAATSVPNNGLSL